MTDIAIIGAGPAGLSAAIQIRNIGMTADIFSNDISSNRLYASERIDNYAGMNHVSGKRLLDSFADHAKENGAVIINRQVSLVMKYGDHFMINASNEIYEAKAIIIATGAATVQSYKNEQQLLGRGISYCATCDGMLYKGKNVYVIAESALASHEAQMLSDIGCDVTFVRTKRFKKLSAPDNISIIDCDSVEFLGEKRLEGILIDGTEHRADGVFIVRDAVLPSLLINGLETDGAFIKTDRSYCTNISGVFAAGDCTGRPFQIAKAVGEGQCAAVSAVNYIKQMNKE